MGTDFTSIGLMRTQFSTINAYVKRLSAFPLVLVHGPPSPKSAWFLDEERVVLRWRKEYSFCPSTRTAAALRLPLLQLLHQDCWRQPDWNISVTIRRDFKRTTWGSPEPIDLDSSLCSRSPPNHYYFCGVLVMSTKFNESVQAHV